VVRNNNNPAGYRVVSDHFPPMAESEEDCCPSCTFP
jgi:hypothetical protein